MWLSIIPLPRCLPLHLGRRSSLPGHICTPCATSHPEMKGCGRCFFQPSVRVLKVLPVTVHQHIIFYSIRLGTLYSPVIKSTTNKTEPFLNIEQHFVLLYFKKNKTPNSVKKSGVANQMFQSKLNLEPQFNI